MRWLHISDLDFGGAGKLALSEKETWDSLLNHVDERTRTGLGPDYIFISGNITRNASIKNFELAKKRIPLLLKKAGLMPDERGWNRIFLVPGNHDIEPALNVTSPKLIKEPTMIRLLNAGHDGQNQNFAFIKKNATKILNPEASIYYPELNNFNQFLQDSMLRGNLVNEISPTGITFFARLEDQKIPVGVICINTAWAPYINNEDDGANSIPCGSKLVEAAIEILEKQGGLKLLIILGHHPANNLYDFTDVREKAQSKGLPLLYLSSHLHDQDWVYYHNGVGPFVEIGAGAIPHEKHSAYTNYHRINWGYFDGDQIEFEPLCYNHFHPHIWTLDTEAFPNRNFQEYRLKGTINKGHFYFTVPPRSLNSSDQKLDCIGIGLAALSTVAAITRGFASDNDYKADVDGNETPKFWEPELGTFVTLACQMLSKWERNVALITSMGSDYNGLVLRRLLQERNIGLLYCRPGSHTGRQIVMTPQNCTDIRYIIDLHIQRGELSDFEKAKLEDLMPKILQSKWIAFDKYELAVIECIFESSQWNMAKRRPLVLFESGSRPLGDTQATSERGLVELKFLDNIDLFTTTWEWISTWAKKDGKSRGNILMNGCLSPGAKGFRKALQGRSD